MKTERCPQRKWSLVEWWRYKVIGPYGWRVGFIVVNTVLTVLVMGCTPLW